MTVRSHQVAVATVARIDLLTVDATDGTFTLTINGNTSTAIAYDIDAATLQTVADILAGTGQIAVTDGPGNDGGSTPYTFTTNGRVFTYDTDVTNLTGTADFTNDTAGTPPARLDSTNETDARDGSCVYIKNISGGDPIYLGGPDVTSSNGYVLAGGEQLYDDLDVTDAESLWACTASGDSATVAVLETGV